MQGGLAAASASVKSPLSSNNRAIIAEKVDDDIEETMDFSDDFPEFPVQFEFDLHGLGGPKTQEDSVPPIQGLGQEDESLEPQGDDSISRLPPLSDSEPSLEEDEPSPPGGGVVAVGAATNLPPPGPILDHVTRHVTGAIPRADLPIVDVGGALDDSIPDAVLAPPRSAIVVSATETRTPIPHSPLSPKPIGDQPRRKAISFDNATTNANNSNLKPGTGKGASLSCINTMPPRRNRYAPRDIDRTSQDSFAGPPLPLSLHGYLNYKEREEQIAAARGETSEAADEMKKRKLVVLEDNDEFSLPRTMSWPSHKEKEAVMPLKERVNENDSLTEPDSGASNGNLDARVHVAGPSMKEPVVLVKDTQSQSQSDLQSSQKDRSSSKEVDGVIGGGSADSGHGSGDSQGQDQTQTQSLLSSSSTSFVFPTERVLSPTQSLPHSDSHSHSQSLLQRSQSPSQPRSDSPSQPESHIAPSILQSMGIQSPFPIAPHRLQAIKERTLARANPGAGEVIPETPTSLVGLSLGAGVPKPKEGQVERKIDGSSSSGDVPRNA